MLSSKNMSAKLSKILLAILIIGLIFQGGYYLGVYHTKVTQPAEEVDLSLFWEAYNRLKDNYIHPGKIDPDEVVYGAIRGMLDSLDDPYTTFYNPEESKRFLEDVSGYYQGVGMEIGLRDERIRVISPIDGTPACRAGIRSGDTIIKIDEKSALNLSLEEAVNLIRGEESTLVEVTVLRGEEEKVFELKREVIQIPSLEWEIIEDNIGYLKIHYFHQDLPVEFAQKIKEIVTSPADKIILDVRRNPGGSLNAVNRIADWFLEEGEVIVKSQGADGTIKKEYKSQGSLMMIDKEIVILIDQGSASASEILVGALRDHRGSKIVGQPSFGKGSIQNLINLRDMSNIKVTTSYFVTPKGDIISEKGIKPDYTVEITEEDFEEDRDPQLEKAIEIIKN